MTFNPEISWVQHAKSVGVKTIHLQDVLGDIQGGRYKAEIEKIRNRLNFITNEAAELKESLPGIMFSGLFSKRSAKGLKAKSGLICADLDKVENVEAVRVKIQRDPHTLAVFVSPSGTGLKVLLRIDPEREPLESFTATERYFLKTFGETIDPTCKDVCRLCFVSYDPNLFQNLDAKILNYEEMAEVLTLVPDKGSSPRLRIADTATVNLAAGEKQLSGNDALMPMPEAFGDVSKGDVRRMLARIPTRPDYDKWLRISSAVFSALSYEDGFEVLSEWSPEENLGEYLEKYKHRLDDVKIGTLIFYAKQGEIPSSNSMIILPGGSVSIITSAQALFTLIAPSKKLFYRGAGVHGIVKEPETGCHRFNLVSPTKFRSLMEKYGSIFVWRSGLRTEPVLKPTICPEETAKALLACECAGDILPNVTLLSACPVYVKDATDGHVLGLGWHPENGGVYITGGVTPPDVSLTDAVRDIGDLIVDFDFPTPGDRSRAVASLIGPALKFGGWLKASLPIDIAEADASQAGKGYRHKCVAAIYREVPNIVVQKNGGVGGLDESISQRLIDGRPFIMIDNLRGKLDSQCLEALLTAPGPMGARVPHRGEGLGDPRIFVFQLTSNGVETTRDLANRAAIVRIRKQPQGHPFKIYTEGYVYDHIQANQPYYLGCVFAVIKEWAKRGMPRTDETGHDNREWAQALDWIVQNIFSEAPLLDGFKTTQHRISSPAGNWIRAITNELKASGETGPFIASQIAAISFEAGIVMPGIGVDADPTVRARTVGKIMGDAFGDGNEYEVDGHKIHRVLSTDEYYKTSKSYRFE